MTLDMDPSSSHSVRSSGIQQQQLPTVHSLMSPSVPQKRRKSVLNSGNSSSSSLKRTTAALPTLPLTSEHNQRFQPLDYSIRTPPPPRKHSKILFSPLQMLELTSLTATTKTTTTGTDCDSSSVSSSSHSNSNHTFNTISSSPDNVINAHVHPDDYRTTKRCKWFIWISTLGFMIIVLVWIYHPSTIMEGSNDATTSSTTIDEYGIVSTSSSSSLRGSDNDSTALSAPTSTSSTTGTTPYTPTWDDLEPGSSSTFSEFCSHSNKPGTYLAPLVDKHNIKQLVMDHFASQSSDIYVAKEYSNFNVSTAISEQTLSSIQHATFLIKATHTSGCITKVTLSDDGNDRLECLKTPCLPKEAAQDPSTTTVQKLQQICQLYLETEYAVKFNEDFYQHIPKQCIFEEYLLDDDDDDAASLQDYKVHTFHGKPMMIQVMGNRFSKDETPVTTRNTRTPDWHEIPLAINRNKDDKISDLGQRPDRILDIVLNATQSLYQMGNDYLKPRHSFPYVRMDFFVYGKKNQVAFAEMTFTHKSCGTLFDKNVHNWANRFYGFVGEHPEYDISPNVILKLAEEKASNKKKNIR